MDDLRPRLAVRYMRGWNASTIMDQVDLSPPGAPPPMGADHPDVHNAITWMMVLAAPPLFRTLGRVPVREHVARLVDVYAAYAARGETVTINPAVEPKIHERRIAAVERLRPLLVAWAPPDLPAEITEAAREVLDAEGVLSPAGGWAALQNDGPDPLEDVLSWPEGVPVVLRDLQSAGPLDRDRLPSVVEAQEAFLRRVKQAIEANPEPFAAVLRYTMRSRG